MFKKLIAVFIVLFSISSLANEKIAPIFEDLEYKLSVEWDQKDQSFYNDTVAGFEKSLAGLADDGVTPADLLNYLQSNLKDKKLSKELSELISTMDLDSLTLKESKALLKDYLDGLNDTGANYSGRYSYSYTWVYYTGFGGFFYYYYYTTTYYDDYYYDDYYYDDCYYGGYYDIYSNYVCY